MAHFDIDFLEMEKKIGVNSSRKFICLTVMGIFPCCKQILQIRNSVRKCEGEELISSGEYLKVKFRLQIYLKPALVYEFQAKIYQLNKVSINLKLEGTGDYRKDRIHINICFPESEGRELCKEIEVGGSSESESTDVHESRYRHRRNRRWNGQGYVCEADIWGFSMRRDASKKFRKRGRLEPGVEGATAVTEVT